ncbi:MAG: hypothetical protein HQK51_19800 [Oligoflexia bacterium]|nr:hypothetical protein [Oligoflexia bacterium]
MKNEASEKVQVWLPPKYLKFINRVECNARKNAGFGSKLQQILDDYLSLKDREEKRLRRITDLFVHVRRAYQNCTEKSASGKVSITEEKIQKLRYAVDGFKKIASIADDDYRKALSSEDMDTLNSAEKFINVINLKIF